MKFNFKMLSLLLWVMQFGLSVLFPLCALLMLALYLRSRFSLGIWIVLVLGVLGLAISLSTARSCLRSLRRDSEEASGREDPPVGFNEHD